MPVIRPIRELQNTTEISHFAKTLNEPIFITKNGRNDLVLMNDAVYELSLIHILVRSTQISGAA